MNRVPLIAIAALVLCGCAAAAQDRAAQSASGQPAASQPASAGSGPHAAPAAPPAAGGPPPPPPKPTTLSSRANATGGEALFLEHCVSCHGPNGMGTGLLARRVQPALLEERGNLTAQYVTLYARRGLGNMPAIPRGEVSDDEMKQIAEYLAAGPHGGAAK